MKKWTGVLLGVVLLGSAHAYDDELAWMYDTSERPADAVSVASADLDDVDARPNVTLALGAGENLEARGWFSWLSDIVKLTRLGLSVIVR